MGKRDLKKQFNEFDINIIDFISKLDKTKTKKLTPFILKNLKEQYSTKEHHIKRSVDWLNEVYSGTNDFQYYLSDFIFASLIGKDNCINIMKFAEHLENNRIQKNDIGEYKSWSDINDAVVTAEIKLKEKELSKQIHKVYEDDTWLFMKPLTMQASATYGSGTKWCTTMVNEKQYFYRYSREGILIYVINKKNNKRFGFYSSAKEFSVWDAVDNRIDSLETGIPFVLLSLLREELDLDNNPVNYDLFSHEEKKSSVFEFKKSIALDMEPEPLSEYYLHNRIVEENEVSAFNLDWQQEGDAGDF